MANLTVVSVRFDPDELVEMDRVAAEDGTTRSRLMRASWRLYLAGRSGRQKPDEPDEPDD